MHKPLPNLIQLLVDRRIKGTIELSHNWQKGSSGSSNPNNLGILYFSFEIELLSQCFLNFWKSNIFLMKFSNFFNNSEEQSPSLPARNKNPFQNNNCIKIDVYKTFNNDWLIYLVTID